MSIGFILFLHNLFLCDIDSIYTMFFLILLVILYGPRVCNKRLNKTKQTKQQLKRLSGLSQSTLLECVISVIMKDYKL